MVKLKGFTITESIIALVILSIAISLGSYFSASSLQIPNRTTIIKISSLINDISSCHYVKDFYAVEDAIKNSDIQIVSKEIDHKNYMEIEFQITLQSDTLFDHFIILQHEN